MRYVAATCSQLSRIHVLEIPECYINSGERIGGAVRACLCGGKRFDLQA